MCQQTFLSKTVKIISIITLSTVALGGVLTNASSAMELELDLFPDEMLLPILKQLPVRNDCVKDLGHCAQACKRWNETSSDDSVWREAAHSYALSGGKFHEKFGFSYRPDYPSWKKILEESYPYWDELKKNPVERPHDQGLLYVHAPIKNLFSIIDLAKSQSKRLESSIAGMGKLIKVAEFKLPNIALLEFKPNFDFRAEARNLLQKIEEKNKTNENNIEVKDPTGK
jgi:hypothetical protein